MEARPPGVPRPPRPDRFFADVLTFGWMLPASIAAGAGLGWLGDRLFGTFPVLTAVFGLLGLVGGLRQVWREGKELSGNGGEEGKRSSASKQGGP